MGKPTTSPIRKTGYPYHHSEEELDSLSREEKPICVTSAVEGKYKFYSISWIIREFYFQSSQENWKACSPELAGPQKTELQLCLKRALNQDVEDIFSFTVKRSDSDLGPQRVWVNMRVKVSGLNEANKFVINDKLVPLNKGTESETNFAAMDRFFDDIGSDLKRDTLSIECKMIIYTEDEIEGFECKTISLKSLSDDLLILYESGRLYDIELKIGNYMFPAHKAILCNHVVKMHEQIDEEAKKKNGTIADVKIFDLSPIIPNSDYEAMRRVMAFIYTGNLKHVLEKPSLSIYDWASVYDIKEILRCYASETLSCVTPSNSEVYRCNWPVDFLTVYEKKEISHSEILYADNSSRTWQFHMYLKGNGDSDYVAIAAETNEEIKSKKMCFEVSITNGDVHLPVMHILRSDVDGGKRFEFDEFLYKNWMRSYETEGINLAIKLQLYSNEKGLSETETKPFRPSVIGGIEIESYKMLQDKMRKLFSNTEFCDGIIQNGDESLQFHKFIMASRCSVLYGRLSSVYCNGSTTKHLDKKLKRISSGTDSDAGSETKGFDKPLEVLVSSRTDLIGELETKEELTRLLYCKYLKDEIKRREELSKDIDHTCITRGIVLYDKSERKEDLGKTLILDIKGDILSIVLRFIYTGEIDPIEDKLVEVYKVARELKLSLLEDVSTKILLDGIKKNESLLYECLAAAADTKSNILEAEIMKLLQTCDSAC